MKAYPAIDQDDAGLVIVRIRAEDDDTIGDLVRVISPGEEWAGVTYDAWRQAAADGVAVEIG